MEINPFLPVGAVGRTPPSKTATPPAKVPPADAVHFEGASELEQALQSAPDVRPEKVDHGKQLVSDVNYPPPETIRKISHLLALQIDSSGE